MIHMCLPCHTYPGTRAPKPLAPCSRGLHTRRLLRAHASVGSSRTDGLATLLRFLFLGFRNPPNRFHIARGDRRIGPLQWGVRIRDRILTRTVSPFRSWGSTCSNHRSLHPPMSIYLVLQINTVISTATSRVAQRCMWTTPPRPPSPLLENRYPEPVAARTPKVDGYSRQGIGGPRPRPSRNRST